MAVDLSFDVGRRQVPTKCHGIIEQIGYKSGHVSREEVLQPAQARDAVSINGQRHRGREEAAEWESSVFYSVGCAGVSQERTREGAGECTGGGRFKRRRAATAGCVASMLLLLTPLPPPLHCSWNPLGR